VANVVVPAVSRPSEGTLDASYVGRQRRSDRGELLSSTAPRNRLPLCGVLARKPRGSGEKCLTSTCSSPRAQHRERMLPSVATAIPAACVSASAARTVGRRLGGERPSRTRAAFTAAMAGAATGVAVYRWLRRGPDNDMHDE